MNEYYLKRLDELEDRMIRRIAKARTKLDKLGELYDDSRKWLISFTESGIGLDICCGDFPIGNAIGLDIGLVCGTVEGILHDASDIYTIRESSLDFVVTNYFDAISQPWKALAEWKRVLKPQKPLAICCVNADNSRYDDALGVFRNLNRVTAYNPKILNNHLHRAGFANVVVEDVDGVIRAKGEKP